MAKKKTAQRSAYRMISIEIAGDSAGFDVAMVEAISAIRDAAFGGAAHEETKLSAAGCDVRIEIDRR